MRAKHKNKLLLSRHTLRALSREDLGRSVGGAWTELKSCALPPGSVASGASAIVSLGGGGYNLNTLDQCYALSQIKTNCATVCYLC